MFLFGKESVRRPFLTEDSAPLSGEPTQPILSDGTGTKRMKVLLVPPAGLLPALWAEPAVRIYAQAAASEQEITICHEYADLYIGHPGVHGLAYGDAGELKESFDKVIYLRGAPQKGAGMDWMFDAAGQLGVRLEQQQTPQIILNSFDFVRTQRFGLSKLAHPRIALAPMSTDTSSWLSVQSAELGRLLREKWGGGLLYVGGSGSAAAPEAKDLRGKLTAREIATVLRQCDLLISEDEEIAALAAAIQLPVVYLGRNSWDCWPMKKGAGVVSVCPVKPEDVLEAVERLPISWATPKTTEKSDS